MAPDATGPKASGHLLTITVILSAKGMDARSESCDRIHKNQTDEAVVIGSERRKVQSMPHNGPSVHFLKASGA